MRTLARAVLTETPPPPLPTVFPPFVAAKIEARRGTVTMLAATPGSGKTFLALKWVQAMGLPTLFFSADTDARTILERAAAMVTGHTQSEVRTALLVDEGGSQFYADQLDVKAGHIRWYFESDPTYKDLELETAAFAEAYGAFPEVVVIDNLMNVLGDNENEYASMRETTKALHRLARITGAGIFVLHHMNESKTNPSYPSPRRDLTGKVAQLAEVVLSIAGDSMNGVMRVAVVKNRFGPYDPSGESWVAVYTDLDRGQFFASQHDKEMGMCV